ERLLERRRESFDQLRRQPADEADGVRHEVLPAVVLEGSGRRVERLEETVIHGYVRIRERVQQGRLPDVRVPRQRDGRSFRASPFLAAYLALLAQLLQAPAQQRDPPPRDTAVALELRLAGAPRPDTAAETLEVLPQAAHAREVVLELRELHLQLPLGADGVL